MRLVEWLSGGAVLSSNLFGVAKCFEVVLVTALSVVKLSNVRRDFPDGGRSGLSA
jgi:hypothetical protein